MLHRAAHLAARGGDRAQALFGLRVRPGAGRALAVAGQRRARLRQPPQHRGPALWCAAAKRCFDCWPFVQNSKSMASGARASASGARASASRLSTEDWRFGARRPEPCLHVSHLHIMLVNCRRRARHRQPPQHRGPALWCVPAKPCLLASHLTLKPVNCQRRARLRQPPQHRGPALWCVAAQLEYLPLIRRLSGVAALCGGIQRQCC